METSSQPSLAHTMWISSLKVALGVYLFFVFYMTVYEGGFTFVAFTKTFAGTANFLLAMSLSLSAFGYFFQFLDSKVIYRKYLGLLGYFFALVYTILLPVANPGRYGYGLPEHFWSSDVLLGLAAMTIFTGMALISNNQAMLWIGPVRWRNCLRFGYLAFFLLVVRAALNESMPIGSDGVPEMWWAYFSHPDNLPPPRLLFSLVALAVLSFRLAVEFDKWWGKPQNPPL